MNGNPELSIITVNYNGIKDTERLIESLREHLSFPYELIVVDNGSEEDEAALLQEKYPLLKAIRSNRNLGFAGGNNLGIRQATGDYLLFLNNDTIIKDNSLSNLLKPMRQYPSLGGVSPKIMFADVEGGIQFAGYTPLSRITLRNRLIGYREHDIGQYDKSVPTPYLHGAAMLVRRVVVEKVGMIPEVYFLYYEELDWSVQIRRQGYELRYEPSSTIYHFESSSTGKDSSLKFYYMTRNRLLFACRNLGGYFRILSICYQLLFAIPKSLFQAIIKGRFDVVRSIINGCYAFFRMQPN